jgi:hypothetical protein
MGFCVPEQGRSPGKRVFELIKRFLRYSMAQNQRKVLYEAILKGQEKIASGVKAGRFSSVRKETSSSAAAGDETADPQDEVLSADKQTEVRSPTMSVPYRLAGIIILVIILVVLVAFWLGQIRGQRRSMEIGAGQESVPLAPQQEDYEGYTVKTEQQYEPEPVAVKIESDKEDVLLSAGDNAIVIATVREAEDLMLVQRHFAANGVKTEIVQKEAYCLLITKDRFNNPKRQGSDGYRALQLIKKIGLDYKVSKGGQNFGPEPFQDAYGMKMR